jgi:hypothetical protein
MLKIKKIYLLPEVTNYEYNVLNIEYLFKKIVQKSGKKFPIENLLLSSALFRQAAPKSSPLPIRKFGYIKNFFA